eukprot:scaffold251041_cov15-Tisochrysis_lutea.AAC.1
MRSLLGVCGRLAAAPLGVSSRRFASSMGEGLCTTLSDEQTALKELARRFAAEEMIPVAAAFDQSM